MRNSIFILILLPFIFLGCAVTSEPELDFNKPDVQIPKKPPEPIKNKGSLYSQRGTSLFADKKDLQVGDIIQIVISEDLTSKSTNKRELSSTRDNSLGGGLLASTGTNGLSSVANKVNSTLGVGFSTNSDSSDKGSVKTSLDETFETTVSAIIEETYENGNYYTMTITKHKSCPDGYNGGNDKFVPEVEEVSEAAQILTAIEDFYENREK